MPELTMPWKFIAPAGLVLALGCGGSGGGSGTSTPVVPTPPATDVPAPSSLKVAWDVNSSGILNFAWTAPATAVDGYELEGRTGSDPFLKIGTGLISSSWTSAYLTINTTSAPECADMDFRMRSAKGTYFSGYTNTASAHFGIRTPSIAVASVPEGIQVTWTKNGTAANSLTLERGVYNSNASAYSWTNIPDIPASALSYLDTSPIDGTTVAYRLTYKKGSDSASAQSQSITTTLKAPSDLRVTPLIEGAKLSWTNHSATATEIIVKRASGIDAYSSFTEVAHLAPSATSYEDLSLATGYYTYLVEARTSSAYYGAPSASVQIATLPITAAGLSLVPTVVKVPSAQGATMDPKGAWTFISENYSSRRLKVPSGDGWTDHDLTNATGIAKPGVLLDSQGFPHTVYLRNTMQGSSESAIVHTWFDGSAWVVEEIARRTLSSSSMGASVVFALEPSGALQVVWANASSGSIYTYLEYARKAQDGSWVAESLASLTPSMYNLSGFNLALDSTGSPKVVLNEYSKASLMQRSANGQWTIETVPTGTSQAVSNLTTNLLVTSGDDLSVFFSGTSYSGTSTTELGIVTRTSGSWTTPKTLAKGSSYDAIIRGNPARNEDGTRLALICGMSTGNLLLLCEQGTWTTHTLGPNLPQGSFPAFDANGKLHVLQLATYPNQDQLIPAVFYTEAP